MRCSAAGWRVCGEFEDVASGARADRAGYQALLAAVRRVRTDGRPAAVVGAWLDRFGRSVAERARATGELRALEVELHSVMEGGVVPGLVGSLLAVVAEQERGHTVRRVQLACSTAANAG
jgi:DNA invertase Pin-like site-specific DNA recombinase